jgi:L-ascorbate metabolism protein UlaG (beta-lactamase superfamily)
VVRIEANLAGPNLAGVLSQNDNQDDSVRFWWLGQAGFALKFKSRLLLIDPYLSDSLAEKYRHSELKHLRLMPIPVAPELISGCDWYFCTHGHTDHMDAPTIRGVCQASLPFFLIPRAEIARGVERGIPASRIYPMNAGETLALNHNITVEAVASAHENLEIDAHGNHKFLGYVISLGNVRLYHSGDCIPYPGLDRQLAQQHIDIAFLPINGRDAYRLSKGIPGNFTLAEAIELCQAAHIRHLVGHHFGMFSFNTIARDTAETILQQQAGSLNWLLPQIGMTYCIKRMS